MKSNKGKRKSAVRSAVHRKLAKQIQVNKTLKRSLWRCRKQLTTSRKQIPLSPKSLVRKELRGKKVAPEIRE